MQVLHYDAKTAVESLEYPADIGKSVDFDNRTWVVNDGFHLVTEVADEVEAQAVLEANRDKRVIL